VGHVAKCKFLIVYLTDVSCARRQVLDDGSGHAAAQLSSVRCSLALYTHAADQHLADAGGALEAVISSLDVAGGDLWEQAYVPGLGRVLGQLMDMLVVGRRSLRAVAAMVPRPGARPRAQDCQDACEAAAGLQDAVRAAAETLVQGECLWAERMEPELRREARALERMLTRVAARPDAGRRSPGTDARSSHAR
jgi:hypothetical protein